MMSTQKKDKEAVKGHDQDADRTKNSGKTGPKSDASSRKGNAPADPRKPEANAKANTADRKVTNERGNSAERATANLKKH